MVSERKREELRGFLQQLVTRMRAVAERGQVATYIPQLACVDANQFGISVCLADGETISAGDSAVPFSIQSVSKLFTLAMALQQQGDTLWSRVGREPSNYAFSSIVELENANGIPRNPFVNAGALVITDANLDRDDPATMLDKLLTFVRTIADDADIHINEAMASSEYASANRNFALAYFLRSCGNLHHACEVVLQTYCRQCAIEMSCEQLARSGRGLASLEDTLPLDRMLVRHINALMLVAGHYDGSGEFVYSVGFPGKSGVGGGILAVVPHTASIAVWSPGLNPQGSSLLGTQALKELSAFTGWSIF